MPSFGIVAEGITDQIVIDNVITGYFGHEDEEPIINYVQPLLDATSEKDAPGGWGLVLEYLKLGRHREALQFNDYLVLHIDTDVSEQTGFDVSHREDGRELSVEELAARIRERLEGIMGAELCARHGHRLIFAVAVHSIECWLLPLFHEDNRAGKITGCLNAVNNARRKRNESPLSRPARKGDSKDPRSYDHASRAYTKRKRLLAVCDRNPSLALFVRELERTAGGAAPAASGALTSEAPAADGTSQEP
jgi:hypothetical protein